MTIPEQETFANYERLPEPLRAALFELEDFIGDLDGKTLASELGDNQFVDEGTVDASDAVKAFNVIVAALPSLVGVQRREDVALLTESDLVSAIQRGADKGAEFLDEYCSDAMALSAAREVLALSPHTGQQPDDALDEVIGKLSAAALQSSPKDDQIIAGHIRDSVALLLKYRHKMRGRPC